MGEANLRFVRGDRDTAVRMCMEVIRQVSNLSVRKSLFLSNSVFLLLRAISLCSVLNC